MGPLDSKVYAAALRGHARARMVFNENYTPQEVYEEGTEFFEARDYEQAIDRFSNVLHMFDSIPATLKAKCLYNLGACYYRLSKYHQALAKFEEALAIGSLPPEVIKFIQTGIKKARRRIGVKHVKGRKSPTIF
jgi:tetratricopeptide (TPR) repeat protein